MENIVIPDGYESALDIKQTEVAIKQVKDFFERELAVQLNLTRVSAPLFVTPESGLNDNLNGTERPVSFGVKEQNETRFEIVHSLAKWKRHALGRYGFNQGEGLYTDMNAIRRDEDTDNLHSIFVDQWDWEKIISKQERNIETLKETVKSVYEALRVTEKYISQKYDYIETYLPEEITFISSQELEDKYPELTPKERENKAAREYGAVFITQIGGPLKSGEKHDGRAPDYDDWNLNGDIIVYYPILDIALELSSMGIRVDEETLKEQLEMSGCMDRAQLPFQKALLEGKLPLTIGGGIGQSRICMFYLRKAHIGEVQSSVWPQEVLDYAQDKGVVLL
ncbi:aspartate--ammonia ligase [Anaerosacchariphilus polymeriproducens]|uniref:Aspartate--ammonia ligase n=1 Tax=Anaerosacchariphilus polymeriproducens TaxID=1812858 RepID=A0A371AV75_9FIRM|nr:aspartate--ammonia ligase [Anaerosacchariphilus polymeriproducens]RDU23442.1 aspartate--ammonia ligase [Anaerosacchariphilus polymeriproducens]